MKPLLISYISCLKTIIVTVTLLSMILPVYSQTNMVQKESTKTAVQSTSDTLINTGYLLLDPLENTSVITTINYPDFNKGNINSPNQLIQGKVPGLDISKPGGDPNGSFYLRLRGLTTINCNTQPLIVVDGIPDVSINNIDPNDIESFTVLRDAAAASIYGIRGSNGVILVTTKKGDTGKPSVSYNVYASVEKVAKNLPAMNATQWRALSNEMGMGTDFGYNTDWFKQIEQTALSQTHSLSLSGRSENTSYRASVNYRDGQGVEINTGYSQVNGRINISQKAIKDKLTLDINMSATQRTSKHGFPEAFRYAAIFNPTSPVKSDDPQFKIYDGYFQQTLFDYYNPVSIIELNRNEGKVRYLDLSVGGVFELTHNIDLETKYAVESRGNIGGKYFDKNDYWGGIYRNGLASRQADNSSSSYFESAIHYKGQIFKSIELNASGGYNYQDFNNEGFYAQGGDFITDDFTFNNLAAALDFKNGLGTVTSYKNSNKLVAFFGQFNLNYKDVLFGTITERYEGSSRFGSDSKWNLFHGIGIATDLSRLFRIRAFDMLKLRIDNGLTGNQPSESYLSLEKWKQVYVNFYNGNFEPQYDQYSNYNPDLGAEKTRSTDLGIDFSLLSRRLSGSIDIYTSTSSSLLFMYYLRRPSDYFYYYYFYPTPQWINIGKLRSSGLEISLNLTIFKKRDFSYVIMLNHTRNLKNELVSLSGIYDGIQLDYGIMDLGYLGSPGGSSPGLVRSEEGKPIGQLQAYIFKGIDVNGNRIVADINHDGYIDINDRKVAGNGLPKSLTGFENIFNYKKWDLTVFFRSVAGHNLLNSYRALYEVPILISSYNLPASTAGMRNPETGKLMTSWGSVTDNDYENASFIALDNICLGYNFTMHSHSEFKKIRVYIASNNVFYITRYKGFDPNPRYIDMEDNMGTYNNPLVPGIERRAQWPRVRSFTFGANVLF